MNKINETLWNNYKKVNDLINASDIDSDGYKTLLEERDKIRKELIEFEQIEQEKTIKLSQIESENKHEKIRNKITISTFIITTCISIYAIAKTFKFDQESTITSTLGRNILNGVIPKLSKR